MSKAEVDRFLANLKGSAELRAAVRAGAADTASLVRIARTHGYDIDKADVAAHLRQHRPELTETELDAAVGGVYGISGMGGGIGGGFKTT